MSFCVFLHLLIDTCVYVCVLWSVDMHIKKYVCIFVNCVWIRFGPSRCGSILGSVAIYFISWVSWDSVDTELCVVYTRALLSGPPKLVCRRNNDPNTRRLFDSSELRDVNEPVLLGDDAWFVFFLCFRRFDLCVCVIFGREIIWCKFGACSIEIRSNWTKIVWFFFVFLLLFEYFWFVLIKNG